MSGTTYSCRAEEKYYESNQWRDDLDRKEEIAWLKEFGIPKDCWGCKKLMKVYRKYDDPAEERKALEEMCDECGRELG